MTKDNFAVVRAVIRDEYAVSFDGNPILPSRAALSALNAIEAEMVELRYRVDLFWNMFRHRRTDHAELLSAQRHIAALSKIEQAARGILELLLHVH